MDILPDPAMDPGPASRTTYGGNRAFHNFANDYSHITDPNLRRRLALSEIDKVPFGMYHVRAIAVAGVGFLLDSYDIFAINLVTTLLGIVFFGGGAESDAAAPVAAAYGYRSGGGTLPSTVEQALKAATSAGIIIGQLLFGWLADVFGRRRMYGIELGIIVLATVNCALASPSPSVTATGMLVFWRVIMGVGVGGDYPLSSVITSEFAPTRWRGGMMAAVFSMQGLGQLLSALVALVVTAAFRHEFGDIADASGCGGACRVAADRSWRLIIGFGAVPACFALYYRITIPETPRYTFDVAHDVEKADADIRAYMASKAEGEVDPEVQARLKRSAGPRMVVPSASWPDLLRYFGQPAKLRVLLGTMFSWFFLDLAFYGLALNNSIVLEAIGYSSGPTLYQVLYNNAVGTIILACAGSLPGYWVAVLTVDTFGRKPLQVLGFAALTLVFCVLGFAMHHLSAAAMLTLYILAQFLFNWGPNTTTFIIPGECFPTRYRSTAHGLSAAMGKIGAILAQVLSVPILSRDRPVDCRTGTTSRHCSPWLDRLMQIFALFMLCGTLVSLLCTPETKGVTLEELAGELPTSYNAGQNGSISSGPDTSDAPGYFRRLRLRRLDPFTGGRPAGFHYPRVHARRPFWRRRPDAAAYDDTGPDPLRIGIMTSPEIAAQAARRRRPGHKRQPAIRRRDCKKRDTASTTQSSRTAVTTVTTNSLTSATTAAGDLPSGRPSPLGRRPLPTDDDPDDPGLDPPPPPPTAIGVGVFPGWGAGWGRIDRGGHATPLEDIRLQDVGSLLK